MKNFVYFSLVVLLVGAGGCKKEVKVCDGVYCFVGDYHVVGISQYGLANDTTNHSGIVDKVITVAVTNGALSIPAESLIFQNTGNTGTVYTYRSQTISWLPWDYTELIFHHPSIDDSIYYKSAYQDGHTGASGYTYLSGIKIH